MIAVMRLLLVSGLVLAAAPARAQADWRSEERREGVHLRILRSYHLAENAIAREPIIVIGGAVTIDGTAEEDVVVIGGPLRVGPKAVIRGDVVAVGGNTSIDPAATIAGTVDEAVIGGPSFDAPFARLPRLGRLPDRFWHAAAMGLTTLRLGVVLFVCLLLTLVAPGWIRGIAARVAAAGGTSALVGVAGQILFVPALVAIVASLVMSVVGIPLLVGLPFVVGAGAIVWAAGFAAVASRIGSRLRGSDPAAGSLLVDLFVGFAAVVAVTVTGHLLAMVTGWTGIASAVAGAGLLLEYAAWTVGLGGALMLMFGGRQPEAPPLPAR
jgi:hypothetical protein